MLLFVETTGDQVVAVKRMDIDLDSKLGREMALADNATAIANIEWVGYRRAIVNFVTSEFDIEIGDWGIAPFNLL